MKPIIILDKEYRDWIKEITERYRASQIKASVKVCQEMLRYYWSIGKDLCERIDENKYGTGFYASVSRDLRAELPNAKGLSESNIRYTKRFYELYSNYLKILPQVVENFKS